MKRCPAVDLETEFRKICLHKSHIAIEDIRILLDQYGLSTKQHHIDAVLRRCDHDADWRLGFDEFLENLGRAREEIEHERKLLEQKKKEDKILSINRNITISQKIISFIEENMTAFDELERELKRLTYHKTFKPIDAYRKMDATNKGYVDAEDIKRYFGDNDGYADHAAELIAYWSNWQEDGRLTFGEWH